MDGFLGPGVRWMRMLPVARKFLAVALLLALPFSIMLVTGSVIVAGQVGATARAQRGLQYADALVWLTVQRSRPGSADAPLPAIAAIDSVDHRYGTELGVHDDWIRLRVELIPADIDPQSGNVQPAHRDDVTADVVRLLAQVSDAAALTGRFQPESAGVATALTEHLPQLVALAAATGDSTSSPASGRSSLEQLSREAHRLSDVLSMVIKERAGSAFAVHLGRLSAAVTAAVDREVAARRVLLDTADSLGGALTTGAPPDLNTDLEQVTDSAAALAGLLTTTLTSLLHQQEHDVLAILGGPIVIALAVLLAAAYALVALYRATSLDVRAVLGDISTVTMGALHQTKPLSGRDEFAQMSTSIVFARDRLTSLLGTLRFQATHDELTALGNRALFTEKLDEALSESGSRVAVLFVDLDGFKDITDSFGPAMGDRLLRTIGARFHRTLRRRNLVARLDGEEFGVLLLDVENEADAQLSVVRLKEALEEPVDVDGRLLRVQASVGIVLGGHGVSTTAELMRNAYVTVHAAKASGTGRVAVYEPAMHDRTRDRTELSADLVQAVERGQLSLLYQPIVDLATETIYGVEALVRWEHPTRGPISPVVFVPLAEATGLIVPIGRWVLREAVRQLAAWQLEFPDHHPLTMDVNLSSDQLSDPELISDVLSLLSHTGINPRSLVLEITESALVQDAERTIERLAQLAAMGVRLALDDFGTGYSSLSYLRRLPVTVLKIDKSFLSEADSAAGPSGAGVSSADSPRQLGAALLRSIVELGTGLDMQMVAEGIENREQVNRLRDAGCHLGQGFLWSRPLPADEVSAVLLQKGRLDQLPRPRQALDQPMPTDG